MFRAATGAMLIGLAVASAQTATPRKLIASIEGKDLYLAYCASCHGTGGKGDGPVAAVLKNRMTDLRTIARRNNGKFPLADVEAAILIGKGARGGHGSEDMPVWGPVFRRVENDQDVGLVRVRRLAEYVASLQLK